jgi:hypothetical protein
VPGISFGTDMSEIFALVGSSYQLVTVDGRRVSCANPPGLYSQRRGAGVGPAPGAKSHNRHTLPLTRISVGHLAFRAAAAVGW